MAMITPQQSTMLPSELSHLSRLIEDRPEGFILGSREIRSAAVAAAKYVFDLAIKSEPTARGPVEELIHSLQPATGPQTRSQVRGSSKRKRSPSPPQTNEQIWRPTPLEALYLDGMDDDQLWAQLELRNGPLCDILKKMVAGERIIDEEEEITDDEDGDLNDEDLVMANGILDDDMEGVDDSQFSEDGEDDDEEEGDDDDENSSALGEDIVQLRDPSSEAESNDGDAELGEGSTMDLDRPLRLSSKRRNGKQSAGHPVLDDGFFSLTDFNAETEEAEAQAVSKGRLADHDDEDENIEDDIDFFAPVDDEADNFEEEDLEGEAYYKDFFAPPAKKARSVKLTIKQPLPEKSKSTKVRFHDEVKVKKIKSRGKGVPVKEAMNRMLWDDDDDDAWDEDYLEDADEDENMLDDEDNSDDVDEEEEEDGEEDGEEQDSAGNGRDTIDRFKDDLFAEDEEDNSKDDRSTFEKRQAELAAQITELEAKNIAPKEWMLMGEATSRSRPVNSLLEEDLEFDRIMKPVPVITEESVESLEDLIKKRILNNKFDDVVRKGVTDDKPFLPSRYFELNDQRSTKSLAQIYEDEYREAASGVTADDRDGKLKKEHQELELMWNNICYKLDALTNAHFTPKLPKVTIATVSNIPAANIESTLPTVKSTATMLAPEEIYSTSQDIRSREELTPNEKRAKRNKQKKLRKKMKDHLTVAVKSASNTRLAKGAAAMKREKAKAMKKVVKTGKGVTVIGKQSADSKRQAKRDQGTVSMDSRKLKL